MRTWQLEQFGIENLKLREAGPPAPGPDDVLVDVKALSLNYRDLLVVNGGYNPKLKLPATPISDGAGVVAAVGENVTRVKPGDRVMSHFVAGWLDGPFKQEYVGTTLGTPGAGLAAEAVVLPADAVLPMPVDYSFEQAATLPIAALTAWSALVTVGALQPGQTVLTLGTGGVSTFALQLAKAMGATVIITSSSDDKLARARDLGADHTINYRTHEKWDVDVRKLTGGVGVDLTVENAGAGTLDRSMQSTRAGGTVALLGVLAGFAGTVTTGTLLMKRLRLEGILVDSRAAFERMNLLLTEKKIEPVIDRRFGFEELPGALGCMLRAEHFGKIVLAVDEP